MKAIEISQNIFFVGARDWDLREFHGYDTPRGTTYNSYAVLDAKTAVIDGVKAPFHAEMLERLRSVADLSDVAYIIANHIEQDHSGNIPELVKLCPNAEVVTNASGKMALEAHFDTSGWKFKLVKSGDTLSLGKYTLKFLTTPLLHWPDSMMTYCGECGILFSNDGFGQHYCSTALFADSRHCEPMAQAKKYYANILLPYGAQAKKALSAADSLGITPRMIAPSHGCVWRGAEAVDGILNAYAAWADSPAENKAVVVFDTMWGATARLAAAITDAFEDAGIAAVPCNLETTSIADVMLRILDAKYVAVGSPTLNNEIFPRVAAFLAYLKGLAPKNKRALAFASYGWKPGVASKVNDVFVSLGWQTVAPFEEKYTPKPADIQLLKERVGELIAQG